MRYLPMASQDRLHVEGKKDKKGLMMLVIFICMKPSQGRKFIVKSCKNKQKNAAATSCCWTTV